MALFRPFGPDHWVVLGITVATAFTLVARAPRLAGCENDRRIRVGLAIVLVGNELVSWIVYLARGIFTLPFQLCDLALWLVAWALIGRHGVVAELAFFWGLAGSSQAVLTPDLHEGFPSYPWWQFFLGHCGVVVGAVYLAASGRLRMTARSVWRVWLISNLYVAVAGLLNWTWGTNFGYLARKPSHPSLLDYLGPWPFYIGGMEVIALGLFFLCYGFSRAVDRWARYPSTG